MKFIGTRGTEEKKSFSQAILNPAAPKGGLYSPESLPSIDEEFITKYTDYKSLAKAVLKKFEIDISDESLDKALKLYDKFDTKDVVPVEKIKDDLFIAELWHGPTRAFKDMALQPFGSVLSDLAKEKNENYLILAATSGDTGPATLETFANKENIKVACMYPENGTSDVQRLQMVTIDAKNEKVIGVKGNFDDTQNTLKKLLNSETFKNTLKEKDIKLSAANSVNFGRIIFQTIYHIWGYSKLLQNNEIKFGDKIDIIVPSGNFGNALGGYYAKKMGLPIDKIVIASNINNVLTEWVNKGVYDLTTKHLIKTSSPAMDILKSSNVERVLFDKFGASRTAELMESLEKNGKYSLTDKEVAKIKEDFIATSCSDEEGFEYIKEYAKKGYIMDTHTATAIKAYKTLNSQNKQVAYSTAEWTKFAPSLYRALIEDKQVHDKEALEVISQKYNVSIPNMVKELFEKEITQKTVVSKEEIEKEIINFL
jgi:threonine synthase